ALAEIKSLKTEFDRAFEDAIRTGELERVRTLRSDLESRLRELREGLISPVEKELDLKRQYESERRVLEGAGILEQLPSGEQGIRGIDGKAYPVPSYQEVRDLIREKRDILKKKAEQGFTKLLIVPFGMKLDDLIEKYKAVILKHYADMPDPQDPSKRIPDPRKTKLFAAKEKDTDPDEPLDLDTTAPVWVWDAYRGADESGKLVYDPKEFSQNHGGKTKAEILAAAPLGEARDKQGKSSPAWRILVIEADPNIPRSGQGKTVGGRARLEANKTPNEYLEAIGNGSAKLTTGNQYQGESGLTPEEWLMQAIATLEEKNQVIDDYQGKGSVAYNTGAYFP
ncbi:MAG: hypothetical protein Q8L37_05625, partial [Candidatus Gottesmanbacteria bacterium]|nr:hypothetical protein [Candidatus Gottesmanbacteria bacterium]